MTHSEGDAEQLEDGKASVGRGTQFFFRDSANVFDHEGIVERNLSHVDVLVGKWSDNCDAVATCRQLTSDWCKSDLNRLRYEWHVE